MKKGSSTVQFIVVLIIAIITLGSVIAFFNYFFGSTEALLIGNLEKVKDTLRQELETGSEPFKMDAGYSLEVERNEPGGLAFGLKNTQRNPNGDYVCYLVGLKCVKSNSPSLYCDPQNSRNNVFIAGIDFDSGDYKNPIPEDRSWSSEMYQGGVIDAREASVEVGEIIFQVPVNPGSYIMDLQVYKSNDNGDCDNAYDFSEWQTKRFTMKVK